MFCMPKKIQIKDKQKEKTKHALEIIDPGEGAFITFKKCQRGFEGREYLFRKGMIFCSQITKGGKKDLYVQIDKGNDGKPTYGFYFEKDCVMWGNTAGTANRKLCDQYSDLGRDKAASATHFAPILSEECQEAIKQIKDEEEIREIVEHLASDVPEDCVPSSPTQIGDSGWKDNTKQCFSPLSTWNDEDVIALSPEAGIDVINDINIEDVFLDGEDDFCEIDNGLQASVDVHPHKRIKH